MTPERIEELRGMVAAARRNPGLFTARHLAINSADMIEELLDEVERLDEQSDRAIAARLVAANQRDNARGTAARLMEELVRWRGARNCTLKSWPGCGEHADCVTCIMLEHAP